MVLTSCWVEGCTGLNYLLICTMWNNVSLSPSSGLALAVVEIWGGLSRVAFPLLLLCILCRHSM